MIRTTVIILLICMATASAALWALSLIFSQEPSRIDDPFLLLIDRTILRMDPIGTLNIRVSEEIEATTGLGRGFVWMTWFEQGSDTAQSVDYGFNLVGFSLRVINSPGHLRYGRVGDSLVANSSVFALQLRVPLWVPFALFVAYPAVAFLRGPFRKHRRWKRGQCLRCGYSLAGNISGKCPECGTAVSNAKL